MISTVWKYDAAGNDFVAWDARGISFNVHDLKETVLALCDRRRGIGGDGMIVLKEPSLPSSGTDFQMIYFNADGSCGEMCGNGARSIVRFASDLGVINKAQTTFETGAGIYSAELVGSGDIKLGFPDIQNHPQKVEFEGESISWDATFQIVGVPHTVVAVADPEEIDLRTHGKRLRHHPVTGARGTNVNFVAFEAENKIRIRTFECGVEDETLACGTGCVASAISRAFREKKFGRNTYNLHTAGGDVMIISFNLTPEKVSELSLTGPAVRVFEANLLKPLPLHG